MPPTTYDADKAEEGYIRRQTESRRAGIASAIVFILCLVCGILWTIQLLVNP